MTVYVDDAMIRAKVGTLDRQWCHLMADTPEELHAFAAELGLKRSWFQDHQPYWHYDVTAGVRARALALGAQPVTAREAPFLPHFGRERVQVEVPDSDYQPERELPDADRIALANDWAAQARAHWEAGRLAEAALYNYDCAQVDPDRTDLWHSRRVRLLEAGSRKSLAEQNAVRLAVAGIGPDDPGVRQITANNESARAQAPVWPQADREAVQ
jgi:hypothetical protein